MSIRPGNGLHPNYYYVIGKKAVYDIEKEDTFIFEISILNEI